MDAATRRLIEAIHQSPGRCVLAMTGGGTGAAALLLGIPGGSRTILEVIVPYSERALVSFLGRRPEQFCSAATSRALAVRACERAAWLAPQEALIGIGCTASLATDRPKRGDHRFYLTCQTALRATTYSLTLRKGQRQREEEEAVLDAVLLNALAEAYGLAERLPLALYAEEKVQVESEPALDLIQSLLRGELPIVCAEPDGRLSRAVEPPAALLPGAFNPVHEGHWRLAEAASRFLGVPVLFELSVTNVDKPALMATEIRHRLQQFSWRRPVYITRAPTFTQKASLFPGVVFVVGADTAERIIAPRYYQESETRMAEAMKHIRQQGCRFLVACRQGHTGQPQGLEHLRLPEAYRDLFTAIPMADFYVPISSTALREQSARAPTIAQSEAAE